MTPQDTDSSTLDLFRERLASPFLFTYFWVSCTWNWKYLFWLANEPLKASAKLNNNPYEWAIFLPFLFSIFIVLVVPWVNNAVEIVKRYAKDWFNKWLHKNGFNEFISADEHAAALDSIADLKSKVRELANDNIISQENEMKLSKQISERNDEINSLLEEINIGKEQITSYKTSRVNLVQANNELKEEVNQLTNSLSQADSKLKNSVLDDRLLNDVEQLSKIYNEVDFKEVITSLKTVNRILSSRPYMYDIDLSSAASIIEEEIDKLKLFPGSENVLNNFIKHCHLIKTKLNEN